MLSLALIASLRALSTLALFGSAYSSLPPQNPAENGEVMKANEVKRGYEVKRHQAWQMVDMIMVTFVNAEVGTDRTETRRIVLKCGCTISVYADDEIEARNNLQRT